MILYYDDILMDIFGCVCLLYVVRISVGLPRHVIDVTVQKSKHKLADDTSMHDGIQQYPWIPHDVPQELRTRNISVLLLYPQQQSAWPPMTDSSFTFGTGTIPVWDTELERKLEYTIMPNTKHNPDVKIPMSWDLDEEFTEA